MYLFIANTAMYLKYYMLYTLLLLLVNVIFSYRISLKPLNELETFVSQSKHLPGIPSMDAMHEWKKYSVGDRDMMLLEKIEELTLHVIRLEKRIKDLENN